MKSDDDQTTLLSHKSAGRLYGAMEESSFNKISSSSPQLPEHIAIKVFK